MIKTAPVLDHRKANAVVAEKTRPLCRQLLQLFDHPWHRKIRSQPFIDFPNLINPQADQEDDEITLDFGSHAATHYLGH